MSTTTGTYGAMVLSGPGTPPARVERPIPTPGSGPALVRVSASSMNFHDLVNLEGLIPGPYPRTPMSDGAGTMQANEHTGKIALTIP
jgi:NADPH:quinone reductase-like Zn-dependent oxidoreductase